MVRAEWGIVDVEELLPMTAVSLVTSSATLLESAEELGQAGLGPGQDPDLEIEEVEDQGQDPDPDLETEEVEDQAPDPGLDLALRVRAVVLPAAGPALEIEEAEEEGAGPETERARMIEREEDLDLRIRDPSLDPSPLAENQNLSIESPLKSQEARALLTPKSSNLAQDLGLLHHALSLGPNLRLQLLLGPSLNLVKDLALGPGALPGIPLQLNPDLAQNQLQDPGLDLGVWIRNNLSHRCWRLT